ncbi:MAG: prephenate dehydrogenase/arogenate dehydrogenase family protein [Pirellulales bacterium]|nr:prephenate dehydrogenase/arogenate dehydrogenase family protein [Pirellulales bacterium]
MRHYDTVAIVGVGLIGGSIGLALRERGLAEKIIGIGRRQASLRTARRVGAVTNTTIDLAKGVADAELVVICTPVGSVVGNVLEAAANCPEGTLITDAGSTKQEIVDALDGKLPRGCRFLGSHPLAGSEKAGASHAAADLFEGRVAILTPTLNTHAEDFDQLEQFWSALGSVVIQMSPVEHDRALAVTSHLPHAIAAVLASMLPENLFRLTGAGFHDTTRIAGGDPELWKQIFAANRTNVLALLDQFSQRLRAFRSALEQNDAAAMEALLNLAKKNRDALGS